MTQEYFGTKQVVAWAQSKKDGNGGYSEQEGYSVKYKDGYVSWSPKEAFEEAYQPLTALSFGHAIHAMKAGDTVARAGWNGKGMWIEMQVPDENSKMGLPYIYMSPVGGKLVPWLASQTDMLADDWCIVASKPGNRMG